MLLLQNPDFLALPSGPAALFGEAAKDSFFSSAAWYDLMAKFGLERFEQTRLYLDCDAACQLALMSRTVIGEENKGCRILRSLTNSYSCEHKIILKPSADGMVALQRLGERLAGERPAWDRILLDGFDSADPTIAVLAGVLRSVGLAVKPFFDSGTWYERTAGLSFADYVAQRPSMLRNTWRRKLARLDRAGRSQFKFYGSTEDLETGIADYQEVYANSWKPHENFPRFIPELIRMAGRVGALRLGTLHFGGRPLAAQFWIVWRDRACIFKLAHDKNMDDYSLGTILTMRMMECILNQDKPVEVNFGRGDDPYKKLWLSKRRERWGISAANPRTFRGFGHVLRQTAARITAPLRQGGIHPPAGWA